MNGMHHRCCPSGLVANAYMLVWGFSTPGGKLTSVCLRCAAQCWEQAVSHSSLKPELVCVPTGVVSHTLRVTSNSSVNPDGFTRQVFLINNQFPSPPLRFRLGVSTKQGGSHRRLPTAGHPTVGP